jgi:putative ABC transport system substrate-binding protein
MRRREFITLVGGAAVTWPIAARAQQSQRRWLIGMLASAPASLPHHVAFRRSLRDLG